MSTIGDLVRDCEQRGCRILWSMLDTCTGIEVDHITPTTAGSEVCVMRRFDGTVILDENGRWQPPPQTVEALDAWRQQLHRMPLDEIP